METIRALLTRRETRRLKASDPLQADVLENLIKAAASAPFMGRARPWRFIIVKKREPIRHLAALLKAREALDGAGTVLAVCADTSKQPQMGQWVVDCAAASQNVVLAAHDYGIGSRWGRLFPWKSKMKRAGELLKTPSHVTPFAVIFLGTSESPLNLRATRLSRHLVHEEHWG